MFDVEGTVSCQVFKTSIRSDSDKLTNGSDSVASQGDGHAFQNVDHAEQAVGRYAIDEMIGVPHHDLAWKVRYTLAHCFRVATKSLDILEYPFLVAAFFVNVLKSADW